MAAPRPGVLFVVPPVRMQREEFEFLLHWPRHALVLAAELGDAYRCEILDLSIELAELDEGADVEAIMLERLADRLRTSQPDVVCVHAHAAPHVPVVARILSALQADAPFELVLGGMAAAHLTDVLARLAPKRTWLVRSEVSGRARSLFAAILGGEQEGLRVTRRADGRREVIVLGGVDSIDYPLPNFSLLPMDRYAALAEQHNFVPHLEFSSGCTFHCTFCGVHYPEARGRFRRRPVANVIEEIRHLRETYGFTEYYFCDETFTLDQEGATALCEGLIAADLGIRWRCVTRADHLDEAMIARMARAGCFEIGLGVESGDERVVHGVAKQSTPSVHQRAIEAIQRHGIVANALTILGSPAEDHAAVRRTFEFLARDAKPLQVQVFVFTPVPGTVFFQQPERFGLRIDTRVMDAWYEFDHIAWPVCETAHLSREDVVRYFYLFNRAFPTIINPVPDTALVERVLANRFPVRRKGVTWASDVDGLNVFRPRDGAGSIYENTVRFQRAAPGRLSFEVIELVLTLCSGLRTPAEIGAIVSAAYAEDGDSQRVTQALSLLTAADLITEF